MDAIYLCRQGSNEELRMSLRSLRNYRNLDRVWIFGGCPDWVTNVEFIHIPQVRNKHRHTNRSMHAACTNPDVSDPFIYMNDDQYFMQPIDEVPTLNRGTIREVLAWYEASGVTRSGYVQGMHRTLRHLEGSGYKDPLSFELHTPMVVYKQPMLDALARGAYQRRTVYGALAGLTGGRTTDPKITRQGQPIPDHMFLSSMDSTFPYVFRTLVKLFPDPSPYEAIEGAAAA